MVNFSEILFRSDNFRFKFTRFRIFPMPFILLPLFIASLLASTQLQAGEAKKRQMDTSGPMIRHAKNFSIERDGDRRIVTVSKLNDATSEKRRYWLVPKNGDSPRKAPEGIRIIRVPVESAVLLSNIYISHLEKLALTDAIVGIENAAYVHSPTIRKRLEAGTLVDVGGGGPGNVEIERMYTLQPEVVLGYSVGGQIDSGIQLEKAGFNVVMTSSYLELTPLGRAEWIKLYGALFGKEREAERIFAAIEKRYLELKKKAAEAKTKPTVFCNTSYKSAWHMPAGKSYSATLLRDAGADYLWADQDGTGTMPLDFEVVLNKAKNADVWLNPGTARSLSDLSQIDSRYAVFKAFSDENIYNNNRRLSPDGGNDFWESGSVNPDVILADLIKILHPELMTNHELHYYRRLK